MNSACERLFLAKPRFYPADRAVLYANHRYGWPYFRWVLVNCELHEVPHRRCYFPFKKLRAERECLRNYSQRSQFSPIKQSGLVFRKLLSLYFNYALGSSWVNKKAADHPQFTTIFGGKILPAIRWPYTFSSTYSGEVFFITSITDPNLKKTLASNC